MKQQSTWKNKQHKERKTAGPPSPGSPLRPRAPKAERREANGSLTGPSCRRHGSSASPPQTHVGGFAGNVQRHRRVQVAVGAFCWDVGLLGGVLKN